MKTIIFGFSKPRHWKPYAQAIMWADQSNISHGYTKFVSLSAGCDFIYQNSGQRTNFMSGFLFDKINERMEEYVLEVEEEVYNKILMLCVSREGVPYACLQVLGKGISKLIYILSGGTAKVPNPFQGNLSQTDCIEEMACILSQGLGVQIPLDMNTITVKPFRDFVSKIPGVVRLDI